MLSTSTTGIAAFTTAVIAFAAISGSALSQKTYDTGASDTEIKVGNIMPYSDLEVPELQQGAAAVRGNRRHQVEQPEELPLDHRPAAVLPDEA
jgi:hypothetical protein